MLFFYDEKGRGAIKYVYVHAASYGIIEENERRLAAEGLEDKEAASRSIMSKAWHDVHVFTSVGWGLLFE